MPTPQRPSQGGYTRSIPTVEPLCLAGTSSTADQVSAPKARKHYIGIATWLESLNGRLEGDQRDYVTYLPALLEEDVQSTFEIICMGVEGLRGIDGIALGTATRLVAWAIEDRDTQ
jgi:hypothetical protein